MKCKRGNNWIKKKYVNAIIIGQTKVSKEFLADDGLSSQLYDGVVIGRRREGQHYLYLVEYEDNDWEEMYSCEVRKCMEIYKNRKLHNEVYNEKH